MRGFLKFWSLATEDWGLSALVILAAAFLLAQVFVLRKRYIYVGFLGLGLLASAARRALGPDSGMQTWMIAVQVLAFGNAVVFMVMHSRDNVAQIAHEREASRNRLLADLEEIAARAKVERAQGTSPESGEEQA